MMDSCRHGSGEEGYRSHPSHTFCHDVGELEHEPETQKTCVHPNLLQSVTGYLECSALKFYIYIYMREREAGCHSSTLIQRFLLKTAADIHIDTFMIVCLTPC